jgi:hypothetical protein
MKTKTQSVVLAVTCFLGGFLTWHFLTQQRRPPVTTSSAPTLAPLTVPALPVVSTQEIPVIHIGRWNHPGSTQKIRIDGGTWYEWPDGTMQRTAPPAMRRGYYDTFDTRDLK